MDALEEYINSLKHDIEQIEEHEENVAPLDCCDFREKEVLENVFHALKIVQRKLNKKELT